jgi:hypothetical protein
MLRGRLPNAEKRAKLQQLNAHRYKLPHVTQTAFASFCEAAKADELPELHSRQDQYDARCMQMQENTPYGTLEQIIQLHPAPPWKAAELRVVSPFAHWSIAYANGGGFAEFLARRHMAQPSSPERPWQLVLYADEMDPGNPLAATHTRKLWMFYWSVVEFGPLALSHEDMWSTVSVKCATELPKIQDGVSQVIAAILQHVFTGPHDPRVVGVDLRRRDGTCITIFITLHGLLLDGGAHKSVWGIFGSSGLRLCVLCDNLWARKSRIDEEDGSEGLVCSITEPTALHRATNESILATVDRLARHALVDAPHIFEMRQRVSGFHHLTHGLLQNPSLRNLMKPVDMHIHDPQHTLFADGVVNAVIALVWDDIYSDTSRGPNTRYKDIYDVTYAFVSQWRWPNGVNADSCAEIFSPTRATSWRKVGHVKASSSAVYSIYPVLQYFLHTSPSLQDGRCRASIDAFTLMSDMVDGIMLRPSGRISQDEVTKRIYRFIRSCVAAGWEESMKPKFHWLIHLLGWLSCFSLERKHKTPKKHARIVTNTTGFERSVLGDVTCEHLAVLQNPTFGKCAVGLVNAKQAHKRLAAYLEEHCCPVGYGPAPPDAFQTALASRYGIDGTCHRRDVVLMRSDDANADWCCGEVWLHASVYGEPLSIISVFEFVSFDSARGFAKWKPRDQPELWDTSFIKAACIYRRYTDVIVTLLPPHVR